MDYTLSNSYVTDAGTGLRMHEDAQAIPTIWSAKDANSLIWSSMEILKAAGLAGVQFDKANPASYRVLLNALRSNALLTALDTGAVNAAVIAFTPPITALTENMMLWFQAAATNTGPATLNVNGLGAKAIVGGAHAALQGGEIVASGRCCVVWHSGLNAFVLIESTGAALQVGPATQADHAVISKQIKTQSLAASVATASASVTWNFTPPVSGQLKVIAHSGTSGLSSGGLGLACSGVTITNQVFNTAQFYLATLTASAALVKNTAYSITVTSNAPGTPTQHNLGAVFFFTPN